MDEEHEYSTCEFYHAEDLEKPDVEIETGISKYQEAIDDFINKQKSANTNKNTASDMDTRLLYMKANDITNDGLPAIFCSNFFMNTRKKMEKSTNQKQFPVFGAVYSDT